MIGSDERSVAAAHLIVSQIRISLIGRVLEVTEALVRSQDLRALRSYLLLCFVMVEILRDAGC